MSFLHKFAQKFTTPKVRLIVTLTRRDPKASALEVAPGEEVQGEVCFIPKEDFELKTLSIKLSCVESVKKIRTEYDEETKEREEVEYWDEDELYSDAISLCSSVHVYPIPDTSDPWKLSYEAAYALAPFHYPFAFRIPAVARASYHSVDRTVVWKLMPRMTFIGRQDKTIDKALAFFVTEARAPSPSAKEKETIIKEIVLIPCKYCGGLMPQTSIFCPNCGARRTA